MNTVAPNMPNNDLPLPTNEYVSNIISKIHEENSHLLDEFVTEDEVATSMYSNRDREDNDSVSLDGSCASGSLSGISTCSAFSLDALKTRKNQLINSIKDQLNSSTCSESALTTPDMSMIGENVCTSTPFGKSVPPAAQFLKEWKPSFGNYDDIQSANESDDDVFDKIRLKTKYEEAISSLCEVLSKSHHNILDAYESELDAYKTVNDKKFDEMLNFFSDVNKPYQEESTTDADDTLTDGKVINADSHDNTVIAETSDSIEKTDVPEKLVDVDHNKELSKKLNDEEVDGKDPENLIIGGEEVAAEITPVDEERLLASDDELPDNIPKTVVPSGTVKELEVFISQDEDENRDNNDPKWDFIKNLGTDFEKFKFVNKHWGNCVIPNPKKDLTCRCRKSTKMNGLVNEKAAPTVFESYSRKRLHSPSNRNCKKPRRESCTMLYDRCIKELIHRVEIKKRELEYEQESALNHLAECQQLDQIAACQQRANMSRMASMKMKHYRETANLIRDFRHRYDTLMDTSKQKIDKLRQAACEVREFHEFYPDQNREEQQSKGDNNSLAYLTDIEVDEILEIEAVLMHYENFYDRPSV